MYDTDFERAIAFVLERTGMIVTAEELDRLADIIGGVAARECCEFACYLRQRKLQ